MTGTIRIGEPTTSDMEVFEAMKENCIDIGVVFSRETNDPEGDAELAQELKAALLKQGVKLEVLR